ncbi:hypothetical protein ACFVJ5_15770 [Nocardia sp. NPDC127606]|uniref:hypothetical protein n=1 Tax=Nocardia sp. NPDC127606 TaxID=3345406 RepID=UPI00362C0E52
MTDRQPYRPVNRRRAVTREPYRPEARRRAGEPMRLTEVRSYCGAGGLFATAAAHFTAHRVDREHARRHLAVNLIAAFFATVAMVLVLAAMSLVSRGAYRVVFDTDRSIVRLDTGTPITSSLLLMLAGVVFAVLFRAQSLRRQVPRCAYRAIYRRFAIGFVAGSVVMVLRLLLLTPGHLDVLWGPAFGCLAAYVYFRTHFPLEIGTK